MRIPIQAKALASSLMPDGPSGGGVSGSACVTHCVRLGDQICASIHYGLSLNYSLGHELRDHIRRPRQNPLLSPCDGVRWRANKLCGNAFSSFLVLVPAFAFGASAQCGLFHRVLLR